MTETLTLTDRGRDAAKIVLGEHEGRWFFALSFQQRGGDNWGHAEPWNPSREPDRGFASRSDALAGVIANARQEWAGREAEFAVQLAWLRTIEADPQADLFGGPA